jgi:hypothetical protein
MFERAVFIAALRVVVVIMFVFLLVLALRRATEETLPNTCEIATSFFIYFHFPLFYQG